MVNNNPQAVSTIQQLKRADMDPANAAASALYSGAVQAAQQSVTVPAAQKELDKANYRIDEAFAKTSVQLQATTAATTATTDVPAAGSSTSTAPALAAVSHGPPLAWQSRPVFPGTCSAHLPRSNPVP